MKRYVVYIRVSTAEQGKSGLGLDAQKRDVELYLSNYSDMPYEIIGEYCDVLSGATDDRPELTKALEAARKTGAELLVAKLDRLSRKVSFIATLMDDPKVKLRVASMPNADKFQLHIYAALAEQERDFISKRTIAALAAAKARGVKLGGMRDATMKRNAAIQEKAAREAKRAMKVIAPLKASGQSLAAIAATLNDMQMPTSRGGRWTSMQVSRVINRTT